jgi:hypothetical protein
VGDRERKSEEISWLMSVHERTREASIWYDTCTRRRVFALSHTYLGVEAHFQHDVINFVLHDLRNRLVRLIRINEVSENEVSK